MGVTQRVVAIVAAQLALAGCQTPQPGSRVVMWDDCGKQHAVELETRVGLPAVECPVLAAQVGLYVDAALMVLGSPVLACVFFWQPYPEEPLFTKAIMCLPPVVPNVIVDHEMRHITSRDWHPPLLPLLWIESACD